MKAIFLIVFVLHGLIHLLGFVKGLQLAQVSTLKADISQTAGWIWLLTTLLFILAPMLIFLQKPAWILVSVAAIILSTVLIMQNWTDAKFGMILNIILLIYTILGYGRYRAESTYRQAVEVHLKGHPAVQSEILELEDMQHLPPIVQKYLTYTRVTGKPKVHHFRAVFKGGIRAQPTDEYMPLESVQYNFMKDPARLFYIEAKKKGLPALGVHLYQNARAIMDIRLFGLIPLVHASGPEMDQSETVTYFNDMCVMAPATLIDPGIHWESLDSLTVKAKYTYQNITISALLHFDENGALQNFVSHDRYETDGKSYHAYPWSTPVKQYKEINGFYLPAEAELVYDKPEGPFCYGIFELVDINYNEPQLR